MNVAGSGQSAVGRKGISRAAIIAVGTEMLTPSKVDTNSLFITEQLNLLGIELAFKSIVGDDRDELEHAVRDAISRVDLLVCCGGLGPTDDDLTRPVVADVVQRPLVEDDMMTAKIRARFQGRGLEMPEINEEEHVGLLYDLGSAYVEVGDTQNAQKAFMEVYGMNTNYRDIVSRIKQLEGAR